MQIHNTTAGAIARTYTRGVDAYAQAAPQGGARAAGRPRTDSVSFSSTREQVRRLNDVVAAQPEVRADRVAALKAQIGNGTYRVDSNTLAATLLS